MTERRSDGVGLNIGPALLFPAALLVCSLVVLVASFGIEPAPFDPVGGRLFPLGLSVVLLVLSLLLLAFEARQPAPIRSAANDEAVSPLRPWLKVSGTLAVVAVLIWLIGNGIVGLIVGVGLAIFAGSLILARTGGGASSIAGRVVVPAVAALMVAGGGAVVFQDILRIPLP